MIRAPKRASGLQISTFKCGPWNTRQKDPKQSDTCSRVDSFCLWSRFTPFSMTNLESREYFFLEFLAQLHICYLVCKYRKQRTICVLSKNLRIIQIGGLKGRNNFLFLSTPDQRLFESVICKRKYVSFKIGGEPLGSKQ